MNKPKREVMATVPNRKFQNIGYGFIPIAAQQWDLRIKAVQQVAEMLDDGKMPEKNQESIINLKILKGMFFSLVTGDQWDWFTTARMLGFPSAELSRQISIRFHRMAQAVNDESDGYFEKCLKYLRQNHVGEMLDNYIDIACRSQHPIEEEGWAYILWSSSSPDELFIGASGGQIDEVTRQLRIDNPQKDPYGVLGAWLVHDPVKAYQDIRRQLSTNSLGCGYYRVDLGSAKEIVSSTLQLTDNYASSPWHVCDPTPDNRIEFPINETEPGMITYGMAM